MTEKILQEQIDKYRVEYSCGTTGGRIGFSVRAMGDNKDVVLAEAQTMAIKALEESNMLTEMMKK